MSVKRSINDLDGHGVDMVDGGWSTRPPLKKTKSISDEIGPLMDNFHVKQEFKKNIAHACIKEHEEHAGEDKNISEAERYQNIWRFAPHTSFGGPAEPKELPAGNGSLFGHLVTSTSKQVGAFVGINLKPDRHLSPPGCNVHLPHPTLGLNKMEPMGMHIESVNDQFISGFKVLRVEEGTLAEKVQLREHDVLIAINETCIRKKSLADVQLLFGRLNNNTFSMTVVREDEEGHTEYIKVTTTVEMRVTDDDVISITIVGVKSVPYYYRQTVPQKLIIAQKLGYEEVTRYLKISSKNARVTMSPQYVPDQCLFTMNLYNGTTEDPTTVCTLCNIRNSQALDAAPEEITLAKADDLTDGKIESDNRFFYDFSLGEAHEHVFESIEKKDHYLTFEGESGTLKLTPQIGKEIQNLPSACRFTMCGEKCDVVNNKHVNDDKVSQKSKTRLSN